MAMKTEEAKGLRELVGVVLDAMPIADEEQPLWYRGVSRQKYEQLPKLLRDGKSNKEVLEREARLLTRFRQRSLPYWPEGHPQHDWEHLFAMQHNEFPTRLLDWTENLYIAAYFALYPREQPPPNDDPPTVWVINPVRWNRATITGLDDEVGILTTRDETLESYAPDTTRLRQRRKPPVALYGTHNTSRVVSQRGTFMVWGTDTRSLEAISQEQDADLLRVTLSGDREEMFRDLRRVGFTETMVFPELPYLAKELTRAEGWSVR